jgi:lysophospholipase L1-like esterase
MKRRDFLASVLAAPAITFPAANKTKKEDNEPFVINAGVGGNNTVDLLNRIEKDCLAHRPDLTILMVGTNDMNSKKHVPLATYRANLIRLVTSLKQAGSEVMLMSILPVYEPYLNTRHPKEFYEPDGHAARKQQVNDVVRQFADELKLPFLDLHPIFERIGDIGEAPGSLLQNLANSGKKDGVHPTPEGYRTIAVSVYQKLLSLDRSYQRVVCFGDSITHGGGGTEGHSYPAYLKRLLGY